VTIVDVPYVPLVREASLRQVNAWGMHDEIVPEAWPPAFGKELPGAIGKHPLAFDTVEPQSTRDKLQMAQELRRGVGLRARMVERFAPGQRLFITTFAECHKAGHYLAAPQELKPGLTNEDAFAKVLEPLDEAWPRILQGVGADTHVFLFALHGIREQAEYSSYANQLLQQALGKDAPAPPGPDLLRRLRDLLPDSIHRAIWRRLPARLRASRQGMLTSAGADIAHDAVLRVAHDGHPAFRMNLAGRERDGIASEEQGTATLAGLAERAESLRTPAGEQAFVEMIPVHERWPGPRTARLPDALLLANPDVKRAPSLRAPDGAELLPAAAETRNGVHNGTGFCFYRAAANSPAKPLRQAVAPADFAPTILWLMGAPPPEHLEGTAFLE
jgi:predicted AlkP superfamily phosphohydrolase/phosphomutase